MKEKILGIVVCTLLIATVLSGTGTNDVSQDEREVSFGNEITYVETPSFGQFDTLSVEIVRPEKALYINDTKLFPLIFTLIFGPITIEAKVTGDSAEKVEFYIDNVWKNTDYSEPFSWKWDETVFFKHTIKVKAYNHDGFIAEDEISVLIFNRRVAPEITLDKALEILMTEIIAPASSAERISAFMLSQPLKKNDVVSSDSGETYDIESDTWFIFIDDEPEAFFEHETRYVFLDATTGSYEIEDETWPPLINGVPMFDPYNLSRGELIEIYPILNSSNPISSAVMSSATPLGDYGDAPDGQDAYYGVPGRFPTLYNTVNSLFNRPGGHILHVGEEMLGFTVSAEVDANDPTDPDGMPNLVDADRDERSYVILIGRKARIAVTVTISSTAPDVPRYINVLVDFDQNGTWSAGVQGTEWVVVNHEIRVPPGKTETIILPEFRWGTAVVPPSPVWMRIALTRQKVNETLFLGVGGWDGSGQFQYGEIEDHLAFLTDIPPEDDDEDDDPKPKPLPPGEEECACGIPKKYYQIRINFGDTYKHISGNIRIVQASVDRMRDLCNDDPNTDDAGQVDPPKPGETAEDFINNIKAKLEDLKARVKCCDEVLIYICGHGRKDGGIAIKNSKGKNLGFLKPGKSDDKPEDNTLNGILNMIPPCTEEEGSLGDCDEPETCCNVKVIIESCYAGNFKGVAGQGRLVIGTSDDTVSGANSQGGIYTGGFVDDRRDPNADTNDDGYVDTHEAHESAKKEVQEYNKRKGKDQTPWEDNRTCGCECPCYPSVDVEKRVWDEYTQEWVDEIVGICVGRTVYFEIGILNNGTCRNVTDLEMIDILPYCLGYGNEAVLYLNGEEIGPREPDSIVEEPTGFKLTWDLDEIEKLRPGDNIMIRFTAYTEYPGENVNWVYGEAHCECDPSIVVSDQDTATVYVTE